MSATYMNYVLREFDFGEALMITLLSLSTGAIPFYLNYFYFADYLFKKRQYLFYATFIFVLLAIYAAIINFTDYGWLLVDESSYDRTVDGISSAFFFLLMSTAFSIFLRG